MPSHGARTALMHGLSFEGLTPREREVLGLSVRTVDNTLAHAYSKLNLRGRKDLRVLLAANSPSTPSGPPV